MNQLLPVCGLLSVAMGVAWLVPAIAAWSEHGALAPQDYAAASVGPVLILSGIVAFWFGFQSLRLRSIPAPVRAAITANALFLAFCALEFSDGLLRQGGRVFYWTSVLFLPALVLFCGQVAARRWAWWGARLVTGLAVVWFTGFLAMVPFVHLQSNGVAIPWWGRIYVAGVTFVFAGISVYAFRSLGRGEARTFYGMAKKAAAPCST
jgi:hypothetical protein